MIKEKIKEKYPHHLTESTVSKETLFISDYTDQTKGESSKHGTKICEKFPPSDIDYFSLHNSKNIEVVGIPFNEDSFRTVDDKTETQCECVIFPESSNIKSWICFIELKYSSKKRKNPRNFNKAKKQLIETQKYYRNKNVFSKTNTCYLFISFPKQDEPFSNIYFDPSDLLDMKEIYNIVMRPINSAEIIDDKQINA